MIIFYISCLSFIFYRHEETVLRPRTFYKKLYLPSLSGHTEPDIVLDCTMSSETDSEVEDHTNKYKDEVKYLFYFNNFCIYV